MGKTGETISAKTCVPTAGMQPLSLQAIDFCGPPSRMK